MSEYRFLSRRQLLTAVKGQGGAGAAGFSLESLAEAFHNLSRASGRKYDYVIESSVDFRRWFMERPGISDDTLFFVFASGPGDRADLASDRASDHAVPERMASEHHASGQIIDGQLVSNLVVTVAPLRFGERELRAGLIDAVQTARLSSFLERFSDQESCQQKLLLLLLLSQILQEISLLK